MRLRLLPLILIALPALEIATFIVVGSRIGVLATLGLVFLSTVAGFVLLRSQGIGLLGRLRADIDAGRGPERSLIDGALMVVGALLLVVPGFLTDIAGLLLFVPAIRGLAWSLAGRQIVRAATPGEGPSSSGRPSPGRTIDLGTDDYSAAPNPDSPWANRRPD